MLSVQTVATARQIMYDEYIKIDEDDLIYTDVDSIILTNWEKYKEKFKIGREMGEFKILADKQHANIIKEKMYQVGEIKKASGLSKNIVEKEGIRTGTYEQPEMIGFREALQRGNLGLIGEFEMVTKQLLF